MYKWNTLGLREMTDSPVFFSLSPPPPSLCPLTVPKGEQKHLKTIREGRRKLMHLQYFVEGHHICGVLAGWLMLGYILVTAGLQFWSSPHFSEYHLSNHHRAKFHMCVLTCVPLTWSSGQSGDGPAGVICYLKKKMPLPSQHETEKWLGEKEWTDQDRV